MEGPYEFLFDLRRLQAAHKRFRLLIWLLNTAIISIIFYAALILIGLPGFAEFYWQGSTLLSELPAILSAAVGLGFATFIKRRQREDFFSLLGSDLSEKARAAYDNRNVQSVVMRSLADDLRSRLSSVKPANILNWRQAYIKFGVVLFLAGTTAFIAQSQISADLTPADIESLMEIRDRALGLFEEGATQQGGERQNLSAEIYGKPSLAVLDEEKLQLQLYPGLATGSTPRQSEAMARAFQRSEAREAAPVPAEVYIESLPPENREIIKKYFETLAGS